MCNKLTVFVSFNKKANHQPFFDSDGWKFVPRSTFSRRSRDIWITSFSMEAIWRIYGGRKGNVFLPLDRTDQNPSLWSCNGYPSKRTALIGTLTFEKLMPKYCLLISGDMSILIFPEIKSLQETMSNAEVTMLLMFGSTWVRVVKPDIDATRSFGSQSAHSSVIMNTSLFMRACGQMESVQNNLTQNPHACASLYSDLLTATLKPVKYVFMYPIPQACSIPSNDEGFLR